MTSRIVTLFFVGLLMALGTAAPSQTATSTVPSVEQVAAIYPEMDALYLDLHQHPELSMHEQQTGAKLAERLKALGYQVTTGVGRTGIVAILKNGAAEDRHGCPARGREDRFAIREQGHHHE